MCDYYTALGLLEKLDLANRSDKKDATMGLFRQSSQSTYYYQNKTLWIMMVRILRSYLLCLHKHFPCDASKFASFTQLVEGLYNQTVVKTEKGFGIDFKFFDTNPEETEGIEFEFYFFLAQLTENKLLTVNLKKRFRQVIAYMFHVIISLQCDDRVRCDFIQCVLTFLKPVLLELVDQPQILSACHGLEECLASKIDRHNHRIKGFLKANSLADMNLGWATGLTPDEPTCDTEFKSYVEPFEANPPDCTIIDDWIFLFTTYEDLKEEWKTWSVKACHDSPVRDLSQLFHQLAKIAYKINGLVNDLTSDPSDLHKLRKLKEVIQDAQTVANKITLELFALLSDLSQLYLAGAESMKKFHDLKKLVERSFTCAEKASDEKLKCCLYFNLVKIFHQTIDKYLDMPQFNGDMLDFDFPSEILFFSQREMNRDYFPSHRNEYGWKEIAPETVSDIFTPELEERMKKVKAILDSRCRC